jgi:hypothetical protein
MQHRRTVDKPQYYTAPIRNVKVLTKRLVGGEGSHWHLLERGMNREGMPHYRIMDKQP